MKTFELIDAALDWAVMQAIKPEYKDPSFFGITTFGPVFGKGYRYPCYGSRKFRPSTSWDQGGPIIERGCISLSPDEFITGNTRWCAVMTNEAVGYEQFGPTPLIAAMRCKVHSVFGDEVDIPKELL